MMPPNFQPHPKVSPEVRNERFNICKGCPKALIQEAQPEPIVLCGLCGCMMTAKTWNVGAVCTDNPPKWR